MIAPFASTESQLRDWREGQTPAERLCADILRLEGFEELDPQLPGGGPDGGKDILCSKGGVRFVAAAHFPQSEVSFAASKKKFKSDLDGSLKHDRQGFIFLTNQQLSPSERKELEESASAAQRLCLIYHRERIRVVLDSPVGYGLRLQHLGIPLTPEEQLAYFASSGNDVSVALRTNTDAIHELGRRIAKLGSLQTHLAIQTVAAVTAVVEGNAVDLDKIEERIGTLDEAEPESGLLSSRLSPEFIRYVHRLMLFGSQIGGNFRGSQVWLIDPTKTFTAGYEPPPWDQVPRLVSKLTRDWNQSFAKIFRASEEEQLHAIAKFFHSLIAIHPFLDGNGRAARQLLALQCRELMQLSEDITLDTGVPYYRALREADDGDLSEMIELIERAVAFVR